MNINNWLRRQIAAISISFSNVEKNLLNQDGINLEDGTKQQQRHLQGTLADSLVHGEVTQEVRNLRWRIYKILRASKGTELEIDYVDENGNVFYKTKKTDDRLLLSKIKLDEFDKYELEMVFNNTEITLSVYDAISKYVKEYDMPVIISDEENNNVASHGEISSEEYFATNKTDKPLNIIRKYSPKFFIENYTKKINVRKISETERLLEFYVSKYPNEYNNTSKLFIKEINKVITLGPKNINFLELDEVNFITNNTLGSVDFLHYSYGSLSFDKIVEFDGNYVIKFKSEIIINGDDVLIEYIEHDLDKKYENKEAKK